MFHTNFAQSVSPIFCRYGMTNNAAGFSKQKIHAYIIISGKHDDSVYGNFVLPRFIVNKSPILNANILFEFHEDIFKISATLKNGTESSELNYSAIVKLMESKQDIYLFISQRQCYILDKSSFTVGCSEDFLKFLQEKNITYKR